jgi:glucokinase-like ROK family protein
MTLAPAAAVKATQQQTKAHNDGLVLSIIYEADEISRAAIARRTALSRTSVGEAVTELLERGLVEETGRGRPALGKPPILLRVRSDARQLIGVDLSGADFRGAVINLRGDVRHAVSVSRDGKSGTAALELVYTLVDRLVAAADAPLLGLGIGTPGVIDRGRGGPVHWAVNLDWLDVPLRDLLELRYRLPVQVLNDSQAAAMGEYFFGAPHATGNLVVIKCEEGLGAGVVVDGRLLHGDHFGAGEIGHLVLMENGRACQCGNRGCLETVASASAILRAVRAAALAQPGSVLHDQAMRDEPFEMKAVLSACQAGDPDTLAVVRQAGRVLGQAVATLVATLDVQDVVIAGRVTELGDALLDVAREEMLRRALAVLARSTQIQVSPMGEDITALGAAAVLLHQELGIWPLRSGRLPQHNGTPSTSFSEEEGGMSKANG